MTGPTVNDPIAVVTVLGNTVAVVSFYAPIKPLWVPPFSLDGWLHREELGGKVERLRNTALDWRWAEASDWPQRRFIQSDFRHARNGRFGFTVAAGDERYFLVPRGWEEPEWGLASYNAVRKKWCDLGDLEPAPELWTFPTVEGRSSA